VKEIAATTSHADIYYPQKPLVWHELSNRRQYPALIDTGAALLDFLLKLGIFGKFGKQ